MMNKYGIQSDDLASMVIKDVNSMVLVPANTSCSYAELYKLLGKSK